ncbi:MAG: hypothetical protein ACK5V3_02725 [Bdellovibrionales bacterium]
MRSLLVLFLFIMGCVSEKKKEPKVHPAALSSQTYFIDWGMPVREVNEEEKDFFFKKCSVDNRGPYPTKTTYDCNEN